MSSGIGRYQFHIVQRETTGVELGRDLLELRFDVLLAAHADQCQRAAGGHLCKGAESQRPILVPAKAKAFADHDDIRLISEPMADAEFFDDVWRRRRKFRGHAHQGYMRLSAREVRIKAF